jgi:tetratricopeptide (TPR) repeat protein
MKSISKLKDEARKHELREEWEKAVQVYLQVLKIGEQGEGEVELPLYNRVGDLYVRLGRSHDAVRYYEQAADRYAEAGLYNNAIALCNKAMRYQPHHLGLLRKLGMFSALQGFYTDARRYFIEYADKQIAQGKVDDALSALSDFARIADDADSRELLGRRLHERGRTAEAVTELRAAHGLRVRSGQTEQAEALRREISTIDPAARFDQDREQSRPPASSFDAGLPGLAHFDPDPFGETDTGRGASGNVQLEGSNAGYGMVDIGSFEAEDVDDAGGAAAFRDQLDFDTTVPSDDSGLHDHPGETGESGFDLPLLPDRDSDTTQPGGFGLSGPGTADRPGLEPPGARRTDSGFPGAEESAGDLTDFDDFDTAAFDLPLLDESDEPSFMLPDTDEDEPLPELDFDDFGDDDTLAAPWLEPSEDDREEVAEAEEEGVSGGPEEDADHVTFNEFFDLDSEPETPDTSARGGFADWPEDPDVDVEPTTPDETATSFGEPLPGVAADDALLEVNLEEFATWNESASSALEEMDLDAAVTDSALREAAEADLLEEEARAAAAREEAKRAAAAREEEARAAAAREEAERAAAAREEMRAAAAREEAERAAAAREEEARAAAEREAEAREFAAREAAAREAAAREAAAREEEVRLAAAREAAAREAAAREAAAREAAAREAAAREAAAREAAAREAEARLAAVREAEARAVAAREAEAREAAAREARAAAARQAEAREAEARAAAARAAAEREAEARAAEEREAEARAAAAREAAVLDPWVPGAETGVRPRSDQTRAAGPKPPPPAATSPAPSRPASPARHDDRYVDLGSLFAEDEAESTRFRIQEALPTGDEDQDFAELLGRFKEKVAEHLPPEDAAAHYDLGLAFKEMGLIDEAIAEFQVALRTGHMRLKVYEELGYCFLHKQQYNIAEKVLRQALQVEHQHELELLGIYYQLGRAYEAMGRLEHARDAYERVLGMDLHFQDTSERLARL